VQLNPRRVMVAETVEVVTKLSAGDRGQYAIVLSKGQRT
jgi:hypothetical protein